jgi:hypothetical protein
VKDRVKFQVSTYGYPVFPAPLVKETTFSTKKLLIFGKSAKNL